VDHRPLTFSPDIIWLMIIQGVANHINANADALRSRFVCHEGRVQISVRRDDFVKGSPENPWVEAIDEFTCKVEEHIGSEFDLFLPSFSTTGPVEKAAAGVVLLDAMQSYFTYDMETFCGIPAISLEGTPDDWQAVADRTEKFGSLDLEWWLEPLRGVLHQFVAASQGIVDRQFWQSVYKYHNESGGPMITGWISALFPYLKDGRTGLATNRNPWLTLTSQRVDDTDDDLDEDLDDEIEDIEIDDEDDDDFDDIFLDGEDDDRQVMNLDSDRVEAHRQQKKLGTREVNPDREDELNDDSDDDPDYVVGAWLSPIPKRRRDQDDYDFGFDLDGPSISSLPSGISKAPFRWNCFDRSFEMEFLGGFVGVSQDRETLAVKPEIGWAVREAPTAR
jgi:hypothetical protein